MRVSAHNGVKKSRLTLPSWSKPWTTFIGTTVRIPWEVLRFCRRMNHNGGAPFPSKVPPRRVRITQKLRKTRSTNWNSGPFSLRVSQVCAIFECACRANPPPPATPDVATLFPGKQKPQGNGVAATYLGDGLLVSHGSLLDERVDLNVAVPARHHHPRPAKTHRDFHGSAAEVSPRFGAQPRRAGRGGLRVEIKKEHGLFCCCWLVCPGIPLETRRPDVFPLVPAGRHYSVCFQTTCLASLSFLPSLSPSPPPTLRQLMLSHVLHLRAVGNHN